MNVYVIFQREGELGRVCFYCKDKVWVLYAEQENQIRHSVRKAKNK